MLTLTRGFKIWIAISLVSFFVYNAYVTRGSYIIFYGYLTHDLTWTSYVNFTSVAFWAGHVAVTARFAALTLGLVTVFLLWLKAWPFSRVKIAVSAALLLEALYFLGDIVSAPLLMDPASRIYALFLGTGYVVQALVLVPLLLVLAIKTRSYTGGFFGGGFGKLAAAAFAGYVSALAVNAVFRWMDMLSLYGLGFLTGIITVGFVSSAVLMPAAVVFAWAGAFYWFKRRVQLATVFGGVALCLVGLYYLIYWVYSYFANSLNFVPLVDVWAVPLLGLGVTLIFSRKSITRGT
jgi:hypothetical protein